MTNWPPALRIAKSGPVRGTVRVPGSKSVTNRALITGALAAGRSTLRGASFSDDSTLLCRALEQLGFELRSQESRSSIEIDGLGGVIPRDWADLDLGNAGTSLRFVTALACLGRGRYRIDGTDRMRERPIGDLVDGLTQLGARIDYLGNAGCPPLQVNAAGLAGGTIWVAGQTSSQFLSSVLLSTPKARAPVKAVVTDALTSAAYVDMTIEVMRAFGVAVKRAGSDTFQVDGGTYAARTYDVAGDAASANYWMALAAATGGEVTVAGLDPAMPQPELGFVAVLEAMGCQVRRAGDSVTVARNGRLRGVDVDMNGMPDSAQTLAALALLAEGPTRIRNVANLRVKETDRIAALERELSRFGARVESLADGLAIEPPARPRPAAVETYGDHRMAMSFAVVGAAVGDVRVLDPGVVAKSYPAFFDDLTKLGVGISPAETA
jgi:3-phosphoshikimate 1-carboxyvinyltransferase